MSRKTQIRRLAKDEARIHSGQSYGRHSFGLWESLAVAALKERGKDAQQIASLFEHQTGEAKNFAYGLAEEIRDELLTGEADSDVAIDGDDRQGRLTYDDPSTSQDKGEQAA